MRQELKRTEVSDWVGPSKPREHPITAGSSELTRAWVAARLHRHRVGEAAAGIRVVEND